MSKKILIKFGLLEVEAVLNETPTAQMIWDDLPMESAVNLWGNEIYFETQFVIPLAEDATTHVKPGTIGYWPMGRAICIFFGPTPLSQGEEIVPAAPVNIIGKITRNIDSLKQIEEREIVTLKRKEEKEGQG